jgi:hypothetical protein
MAEVLFDVKQGRRVYVANAAISTGMLVIPGSTAGQVGPAAAAGPICMVALTDASSSAEVEVMPITRGAEYRFLAGNSVTSGAEVELDSTTGKIKTFSAGTKVGRALEAGASGGLVKVIAY